MVHLARLKYNVTVTDYSPQGAEVSVAINQSDHPDRYLLIAYQAVPRLYI